MNGSQYEIIYCSADDDAFVAEVPELPGCMADGESYQEALANAEIVIGECSKPLAIWVEQYRCLAAPRFRVSPHRRNRRSTSNFH